MYRYIIRMPAMQLLHVFEVFLHLEEMQFLVFFCKDGIGIGSGEENRGLSCSYGDIVFFGENKYYFLIALNFREMKAVLPIIFRKDTEGFDSEKMKSFLQERCSGRNIYRRRLFIF